MIDDDDRERGLTPFAVFVSTIALSIIAVTAIAIIIVVVKLL